MRRYLVLSESVCHLAQAALPTHLCEYLETRIASGALELPILPHVASQVLAMSTSDDTNARSLAELLHRDQAIAAHVLRVANSPLYKSHVPIVSLQQAISRLGLALLREMVITVSMQSRIFNVPSYATEARTLWQHAVYTAAYAGKIARRCRRNAESAFLGGLLHDVNKPVLLLALADLQAQLQEPIPPPVVTTAMDVYHTQVGAVLASAWTLPPESAKAWCTTTTTALHPCIQRPRWSSVWPTGWLIRSCNQTSHSHTCATIRSGRS